MKKIKVFVIPLLFLIACSESKKPELYIAKVNDSYLTESELAEMVDSQFVSDKSKAVLVKNWVRQEILFQEAVKEGLTETQEFRKTIENTKKQLAAAILLENYAATLQQQFTEDELENFFEENKTSFKLPFNSYFLNRSNFSERDAAVKFRTASIMNGWKSAIDKSGKVQQLLTLEDSILVYEQNIQPVRLLRILEGLYPLEISIVIPDERGYYSVVQLIDKYSAGTIPPFSAVRTEVYRRYKSALIELAVENYVNDLYSLNEIEINK